MMTKKDGLHSVINNAQIAVFLFGVSFIIPEFSRENGRDFADKKIQLALQIQLMHAIHRELILLRARQTRNAGVGGHGESKDLSSRGLSDGADELEKPLDRNHARRHMNKANANARANERRQE